MTRTVAVAGRAEECRHSASLEDSPAGVLAGRAARATVIALRTTHPDDKLPGADALADDLAALIG
jgi:beta-phosphoglucomutase-like phosphatase (HAD superfamily)